MPRRTVALPCSVGALIAISSLALADPPAPPTSAPASATTASGAADNGETLEEIVVTAEKRSENLEVVPVAVTAFTSRERDLIGVQTIQDVTDFTPGLAYSTVLDRAFIRGVGRETNNLATQPGVATYNDGLYNSSVVAASGGPLFEDHIEVLRGPQGTLYGRNSIGGTINSISKKPTDDWYAEVRTNIANYGVYDFSAALSGPITDTVRIRLSGYRNTQEDGWFNNLALDRQEGGKGDYFYWEAQLDWKPTADIYFWIKFNQLGYEDSYRTFNTIGSYGYDVLPPGTLAPTAPFGFLQPSFKAINAAECNNNPGSINIRSFCSNSPDSAKLQRDYQVTPQLTWITPYGFDVKYIGGYTTYWYNLLQDFDDTSMQSYVYPAPGGATSTPVVVSQYIENKKYWSNEVDLTSHSDSSFQWIAGLYQYAEHEDQPVNLPVVGQDQLLTPIYSTPPFAPAPRNVLGDNIFYTDLNIKAHSYAAFAQTDWKFLPTWKLTTGLRYNYDKSSGLEATRLLFFSGTPTFPGVPPIAFDITPTTISQTLAPGVVGKPFLNPATGNYQRYLDASWNAVTGTAGLEWQPIESTLGYIKFSRGYKAGGLNAGSIVAIPETNPEYLNAYELGVKYSARKFQINQDFFYYDYNGLQIPLSVQPASGPAISETFNIPKVTSFGSESEIIFRPIADWMFLLDYSYLEAYIATKFSAVNNVAAETTPLNANGTPGYVSTNVDGATVPETPRHKIAFNSNYSWRFAPGSLNFSASYVYKAHTYSSIFNEPYTLAPAYATLDFRTTWTDASDKYTVFLFCHNCTNKLAYDGVAAGVAYQVAFPSARNTITQTPGIIPPRQYGIEIQYRLFAK
jgi:iron complex outermembrane recepter protein